MMKVVDMHCDTILKLYDDLHHGKKDSLLENDGHIDLKKNAKRKLFTSKLCDVCRFKQKSSTFFKSKFNSLTIIIMK